jgi:hypothetical protein
MIVIYQEIQYYMNNFFQLVINNGTCKAAISFHKNIQLEPFRRAVQKKTNFLKSITQNVGTELWTPLHVKQALYQHANPSHA